MKKVWTKPVLESLWIYETAGGTHLNSLPDGDPWQDDDGIWQQPLGEDPAS